MINVLNNIDCVPSNVQFSHQEAVLYVFEDNQAVIKMIIKGRSPTMRHVSRTHRVALHWLFDLINLDPEIQIKYFDTENQLADILTKGNFTRDEWNHLLCLFNISHFSSTVCSETMVKRLQQDSGEERVTAKLPPMMNLTTRMPSVVSSSTSSSPGKTWYEYQDPGKSVVVDDRSGKPDRHSPAGHSKSDYDRSWSSQEWKTDPPMGDRPGQRVVIPQRGARPQQFIIENGETESELSVESRSFLDRVNDQVRKRQKRSSMNVTKDGEKHSVIWRLFMSVTSADSWEGIT